jgi:hypothetical protein
MGKLYNIIWETVMFGALALTIYHLWSNKQAIINTLFY